MRLFNLPHSEVHTVIIPHATAYNSVAAPEAMKCIARALSKANAADGLYQLGKSLGAPTKLSEIGMRYEDLDLAAELASKNPQLQPSPNNS